VQVKVQLSIFVLAAVALVVVENIEFVAEAVLVDYYQTHQKFQQVLNQGAMLQDNHHIQLLLDNIL
jgi:hypothetical protein